MISYELAKELKQAQFPIDRITLGHYFYPNEDAKGWTDHAREYGVVIDAYVMQHHSDDAFSGYLIPSLSELIERIPGSAFLLWRNDSGWHASSSEGSSNADDQQRTSPEEAVARLWLTLHANSGASTT